MKLLSAKIFSVDLVRKNPDKVFLFGDNLKGYGKGGQAIIRNESNAIGIPTKKAPSMDKTAFFTDAEYTSNKKVIDEAFNKIPRGKTIVVPKDNPCSCNPSAIPLEADCNQIGKNLIPT